MKTILNLLACVLLCTVGGNVRAQIMTPVALSGFTLDNVFAGGADPVSANSNGFEFFAGVGNGTGSSTPDSGDGRQGFPTTGSFVSDFNSNTTFQLAPYGGNNITQSINGGSSTLTLATPSSFSNVAFLVTNIGAGGATFTLNFSDGSTVSDSVTSIPYWVNGAGTDHEALSSQPLINNGSPIDLYEYDYSVPLIDQGKTLSSVTITSVQALNVDGNGLYQNLAGLALSGTAVPEPGTYALMLGGLAVLAFVTRLRGLVRL